MKQSTKRYMVDVFWIAAIVTALTLIAILYFAGCAPQPKPGERECWKHTTCLSCVNAWCGWCANGCYNFHEGGGCPEMIGHIPSCPDFVWPEFPPYLRLQRDGGARDARGADLTAGADVR